MGEIENMELAQELYETMCSFMDKKGFVYDKVEKDLMVVTGGTGEDLPILLSMQVNKDINQIMAMSIMPFSVKDEYLVQTATAIAYANYECVMGQFALHKDNKIIFTLSTAYNDCIIGEDMFDYLFRAIVTIVDRFNDKFVIVANNKLSLEQIKDLICQK